PLTSTGIVNIDRILFSTENPLSVDVFDLENNFELYPNPVKETLYIKTTLQIHSLFVLNMLGQEVFRQFGNTNSLSVSNLSPGLYVLKILQENGQKTNRKFIIE
ncbi:MAG: T9SS type A sorting domain-containing protein, partial [Flavobacteriaceae bacterium]